MGKKKKLLKTLISLVIVLALLPCTAFAANAVEETRCTLNEGCTLDTGHEGECTTVSGAESSETPIKKTITSATEQVQVLINALPDTITAENAESTMVQITAIDEARLKLTGEERKQLVLDKYTAAVSALDTLGDKSGSIPGMNTAKANNASILSSPADDDANVWVVIPYLTDPGKYSGTGTENDPYYASLAYRSSKTDKITIETMNPAAKINGGSNKYTVPLAYGFNDIRFTVTSADASCTAFYYVKWQRTKPSRPVQQILGGTLSSIPAADGASDGKIIGLLEEEYYDYRPSGGAKWTTVNGVTEITGLASGTYQVKYGESESQQASSEYQATTVNVGSTSQQMPVINKTSGFVFADLPSQAAAGQRVYLKLALNDDTWVKGDRGLTIMLYTRGNMTASSACTIYFDGYTSENGQKYYNAHFDMTSTYNANSSVEIEAVTLTTKNYYRMFPSDLKYMIMSVKQESGDSTSISNELLYSEGSSVTVELKVNQTMGTRVLKSFKIKSKGGTVAAESTNGAPVSVSMTEDLYVSDIVTDTIYADFTAMEEQLERIKGIDLFAYTDITRVTLQERLALVKPMLELTQKDQKLVDDFVPTLQNAIDGLVPKAGDFTETNRLMGEIPQDLSAYTDKTTTALEQAKAGAQKAIDEAWNRLRQDEIDKLAEALEKAIAGLEYKEADYTLVDSAIEKANKLNKVDYKDFSGVEKAIAAVDRTKNITEQKEVDAMAKAIEDAIAKLEKKSSSPAKKLPKTNSSNTTKNPPKTGDNSNLALYVILLILAGSGLGGTVIGKMKKRMK